MKQRKYQPPDIMFYIAFMLGFVGAANPIQGDFLELRRHGVEP